MLEGEGIQHCLKLYQVTINRKSYTRKGKNVCGH